MRNAAVLHGSCHAMAGADLPNSTAAQARQAGMHAGCPAASLSPLFLLDSCLSRLVPVVRWLSCRHAAVLHEGEYQAALL